jgi:hypothetical protein
MPSMGLTFPAKTADDQLSAQLLMDTILSAHLSLPGTSQPKETGTNYRCPCFPMRLRVPSHRNEDWKSYYTLAPLM